MTTGIVALISAAAAWIVSNIVKAIIGLAKGKKKNLKLFSSGGMPSVHTASVSALVIAIGVGDGFNSSVFALALVFLIVVAYDATHVRRAVGEQGKAINSILTKITKRPYNSIGHNLIEMLVGCLVGVIVGLIISLTML